MEGFTLLHPWLLVGALAASAPVIIHLIGRRRAPSVRFAAFDFLLAVNKRLARREKIRQFLLLLLRTLAILALVMALVRPMRSQAVVASTVARRLAIVLDASASMAYVQGSQTLLENGKRLARDAISHLAPGDVATLVVAGPDVKALFEVPTADHSAVREALNKVSTTSGSADLGTAIDLALRQLGNDGDNATLLVISDLSENSFEGLRPTGLSPPPEVRLVDAAARDKVVPLGNLAIESVAVEPGGDSPVDRRIRVVVRNFGGAKITGRPLELLVDGAVTQRVYADIDAQSSEEKTLSYAFSGPEIFRCQVRLAPSDEDGYAPDDVAYFVVAINDGVRVLAINGDPRTTPYEDEMFFLERALSTLPKGDAPISLRIIVEDEIADSFAHLSDYDVVVLANVPTVEPAQRKLLREFVNAGGGLLFTMGERMRLESVNASYGDLLPHALRDMAQAEDKMTGAPPIGIKELDWTHPILLGLGQPFEESLRTSRTAKYFNLDVGAGIKSRAVLRFDNGAPALIAHRDTTSGRVMLLTTSIDLDLSDLALRSGYPALMQRTTRYLARALDISGSLPARTESDVVLNIPLDASRIALISPQGERVEQQVDEGKDALTWAGLKETGIYQVEVKRGDSWAREAALDLAVNASLKESNFTPVVAERVGEALGGSDGSKSLAIIVGGDQEKDPFDARGFAPYLLLGLCLLFAGESMLAARG